MIIKNLWTRRTMIEKYLKKLSCIGYGISCDR